MIFFRYHSIRNKNCLWWPCLLMDRDKMGNLYRGPSIYASYQVSVYMVEGFQRRRLKCEKLTDDRRRTTDAKWWQKLTLPLARWAKKMSNTDPTKNQILAKGKQFLPLIRHPPCYSYIQDVFDTIYANTNNMNKTWTHLQTTGGKDEPNNFFMRKS
jgi:hypothetical protein